MTVMAFLDISVHYWVLGIWFGDYYTLHTFFFFKKNSRGALLPFF